MQESRDIGKPKRNPKRSPKQFGFTRRQKRDIATARDVVVRSFGIVLVLGCLLGAMFFLRPATSEVENRNLTPFPELTWDSFASGQFFSDLSLWYADTFPFREQLVGLDRGLKSLYGVHPEESMVGGNAVADEIPEEASAPAKKREVVEPPNERQMAAEIQDNIMSGLYVRGGSAFSIYYFSKEAVDGYAAAINECATQLEDKANVYSILAPNNSGVMLSEEELAELGGSDQAQAIRYFNSLYEDSVIPVDVLGTMREHNREYLYYHTDHHWTALGAYYAYLCYCEAAGIEPVPLDTHETMVFQPFLGTFCQQLQDPTLESNPDYVEAFIPNGTNDMRYIAQGESEWTQGEIVTDVSTWGEGTYYNTFIMGDEPVGLIENPQIQDGSSVLVVKDSFGNAFVPFLVDNYQYVYVIDFRYYDGNIPEFVEENGIQNVVFLNNLSMAGTVTVADKLATMM